MLYDSNTFDYSMIHDMPVQEKGRHKRSGKASYKDAVSAFDIETTSIRELKQAIMYIWQFQIEDQTVIGRTWDEFVQFYSGINKQLQDDEILVCYVHNLSFEFQFLKSIIPISDVMALDTRKILRFRSGRIEFRCSYLHSNMSLDKFLQKMDIENKKLHDFDYSKYRFSDTPLSDRELEYCVNDVKGLVQALKKEMKLDGDDLYTIPLTSTGYIRKEAREALQGYKKYIKPMLPDLEVFEMLRRAFRGGNTHANRYNSNRIIEASEKYPINSIDISSSYPFQLVNNKYPAEFVKRDPKDFELALRYNKACLFTVRMKDLRLKNELWGCPYISRAKCDYINNGVFDNGRVLQADGVEMTITEIDFKIISSEYSFEYEIIKLFTARKIWLPEKFRELVLKGYRDKTQLKGVDEYAYGKRKNQFNSLYGMCVQNPCKPELIYDDSTGDLLEDYSKPLEKLIEEYHATGWLPYQWGVWCTCYARLELERGMNCIPPEAFIYTDTDSIKFVGDYMHNFDALNDEYRNEEFSAVDRHGVRHYMGVFENDADLPILRFKTMGAKKYAYECEDGLHLTLAGVSKKQGPKELGTLDNFKQGFIFTKSAGTESIYNDDLEPQYVSFMGRILKITSNIYIQDSTYTLDLTLDYAKLINFLCNTDIRFSLHFER